MIIASIYPCPYDNQIRHDFSSAIFKDGEIYAYEEDKASGFKNFSNYIFPEISLFYGFKELNIDPEKINFWLLPTPSKKFDKQKLFTFFSGIVKCYKGKEVDFQKWLKKKVIFIDHHDSHVGLAVSSSGFKKTAYLSVDGGGDFGDKRNCLFGEYSRFKFKNIFEDRGLNNICSFHAFITDSLCFGVENGKVNGLSAYGKVQKKLIIDFEKILKVKNNGIFFNRKRFEKTKTNFTKFNPEGYQRYKVINRQPSNTNIFKIVKNYKIEDVAKTAEEFLKNKIFEFLHIIKKKTSFDNIVFSGGLFLNVSLNGLIVNQKIFKRHFFNMAPSDNGLSLGAIAFNLLKYKKKSFKVFRYGTSPYLGPSFTKNETKQILDKFNLKYVIPKNYHLDIAKNISKGKIIGLFDGRAEFGQRSLGNRSILADPRSKLSKLKLNLLLKKRDWFMPFAPAILDIDFENWFPDQQKNYYMQSINFLENKKLLKKIPSAVHVDGSCRCQYVEKKINNNFWKIINYFKKLTKIPILLNTSFNRHGISTIATPRQAVEHLMEGSINLLYINGFKVTSFSKKNKKNLKKINILEKKLLIQENEIWNKKIRNIQ